MAGDQFSWEREDQAPAPAFFSWERKVPLPRPRPAEAPGEEVPLPRPRPADQAPEPTAPEPTQQGALFSWEKPQPQPPPPLPAPPPDQDPGAWQVATEGLFSGWEEAKRRANIVQSAVGNYFEGKGLAPSEQDVPLQPAPPPPSVKAQLDRKLDLESAFDPKFWLARAGYGLGESALSMGAGMMGMVGGPTGGAVATGLVSGTLSAYPNYQEAIGRGLSPDDAAREALKKSALEGVTDAAGWRLMGMPLFGRVAREEAGTVIGEALKHPFLEALAQIGLVQPGVGQVRRAGEAAIENKTYGPGEALTGWAEDVGGGALQMGAFHVAGAAVGRAGRLAARGASYTLAETMGLREELLKQVYGNLETARQLVPPFLRFSELVERHPEDKRTGSDWLSDFAKDIPDEYLQDLIPHWAVDKDGKIDKSDLTQLIRNKFLDAYVGPKPGSGYSLSLMEPKGPEAPLDMVTGRQADYYDRVDLTGKPSAELQTYGLVDTWKMGDALRVFRHFVDEGRGSITFRYNDPAAGVFLDAAGRIGLDRSTVKDANGVEYHVVDLDKRASGVNLGLPFSVTPTPKGKVTAQAIPLDLSPEASFRIGQYTEADLRPAARRMIEMMKGWHSRFSMQYPVEVKWYSDPANKSGHGSMVPYNDRSEIRVNLSAMADAATIYETLAHEFGHALVYDVARRLDPSRLAAIMSSFSNSSPAKTEKAFREQMAATNPARLAELDKDYQSYRAAVSAFEQARAAEKEVALLRDPAVKAHWWMEKFYSGIFKDFDPGGYPLGYWKDFHEYMANQIARWATTDERPLSDVDRTLYSLGRQIRQINEFMAKQHPSATFTPDQGVQGWLNDFVGQAPWTWAQVLTDAQLDAQAANRAVEIAEGGSGNGAVPFTPTTGLGRKVLAALGIKSAGPAYADKINKFYEWALNLRQLALKNQHVRGLVMYNGLVNLRDLTIKSAQARYFDVSKQWESLGTTQGDALGSVINDYMLQLYRTPDEVAKGIMRMPTPAEMDAIFQKYKVSNDGIRTFKAIQDSLRYALERVREFKLLESRVIKDPVMQAQEMENINLKFDKMLKQPYFPRMRFGDHTFTVFSQDGKQLRFETGSDERAIDRIEAEWLKTKLPGEYRKRGLLDKNVTPFFGLPPDLIGAIADKMPGITDPQREALETLRLDYSPANSFAHRFQRLERVPGWSMDFKRAFAAYGFGFSKWMANAEYASALSARIAEVRESWKTMPPELQDKYGVDAKSRDQIANFMSTHYKQLMDPSHDIAWLRGAMFHWYLGFSPAKAFVNMTQTLFATYPMLASQFGDLRATGKILQYSLQSMYRKFGLANLDAGQLAMRNEALKEGWINEGQAIQLGALQNFDNMAPMATVRGGIQATIQKVGEWSSYLFDAAEKWNRNIAASAAFDLARTQPNAKFVTQARQFYPLEYQRLIDRGWNHTDASAFLAARMAVEDTQFIYAPYARPKIFTGKLGSLFAFKNFTQNMLFMMGHYPGAGARSALILAGLGGLMGLPGAEDISGAIKGLMYKLFGKDFDPEDKIRQYAVDTLHADPDLVLHGYSRHGFGIPQILDMMGLNLGMRRAYPDQPGKLWRGFDMAGNLGMGRLLPIDLDALLHPSRNRDGQMLNAIQQGLGAGFGFPVALYKALASSQYDLTEYKRWESVLPHFLADASKAARFYREGMEKNVQGNPILRFDTREPIHMAEVIGQAIGARPTRLTEQYDNMRAEAEAKAYWQEKQQILLAQFWKSRTDTKDRERVKGAIQAFNAEVRGTPARLYAITPEVLQRSMTTRQRNLAKQEAGIPTSRKDIPLVQEVQRLHPGASRVGRAVLHE